MCCSHNPVLPRKYLWSPTFFFKMGGGDTYVFKPKHNDFCNIVASFMQPPQMATFSYAFPTVA